MLEIAIYIGYFQYFDFMKKSFLGMFFHNYMKFVLPF